MSIDQRVQLDFQAPACGSDFERSVIRGAGAQRSDLLGAHPHVGTATGPNIEPEAGAGADVLRQGSTSPTTKKIEPRMAIRSGTKAPGSIAGTTLTLKDAVRIFSR